MHLKNETVRGFRLGQRVFASSLAFFLTLAATPAWAETAADLSSRTRDNVANGAGTIKVGTTTRVVSPGDMLTDAEHLALQQILNGGQQSLLLNAYGTARGGTFDVSHVGAELSSLVVPRGVTALTNVSGTGSINITGNLTNSGKIYLYATDASTIAANIAAQNIFNNAGGLLSTTLPSTLLSGLTTNSSLNLNLSAIQSIINAGIIRSSGTLSLTAGQSIVNTGVLEAQNNINLISNAITNSNLINSIAGNINISALNAGNIAVNNVNGTLQALLGNINVRDSLFNAKSNFTMTGGDVLSKALNIYTGTGIARVNVNDLTGVVNLNAGEAHVAASTQELNLGDMNIVGDPTFYNQGNIDFTTGFTFNGEALAIIASGNITSNGNNLDIDTSSTTGNGGTITLVAGANFTLTNPGSSLPFPNEADSATTLTITGGSATGGRINLNVSGSQDVDLFTSASTFAGGDGGDIKLIAFKGTAANSGTITLPNSLTLNSTGGAGGANGDVLLIAGAGAGSVNALTVGGIDANGVGSSGNTGKIEIYAATPVVGAGVNIVDGSITSGAFTPGAFTTGTMLVNGISDAGDTFTARTGGIAIFSDINAAGNVNITAGSPIISNGQVLAGLIVNSITSGGNIVLTTNANNTGIGLNGNLNAQGDVTITAHGTGSILGLNRVIQTITTPVAGPGNGTPIFDENNQQIGTIYDYLLGATVKGDRMYVPQFNYAHPGANGAILVYDLNTNPPTLIQTIGGLNQPQGTAVSPDGSLLYVANAGSGTISIINTTTFAVTTVDISPTGTQLPQAVAVAPNGTAYVLYYEGSATGAAKIAVVNGGTITSTIALSGGTGLNQSGGIIVNPQGTLLYATAPGSKQIFSIDLANNSIIETISVSALSNQSPYGLAMDPTGSRLYIAEAGQTSTAYLGNVLVMDVTRNSSTFNDFVANVTLPGSGAVPGYPGSFPQALSVDPIGATVNVQSTYLPGSSIIYTGPNQVLEFVSTLPSQGPDGYGSSSFSTIRLNGEVNNVVSYTSNTQNVNGAFNTISVMQKATVMGDNVTLNSSGGNIILNYQIRDAGGTMKANTTGSGAILLGNVSTVSSNIGASAAPSNFFEVNSLGSLTVTGAISSPNVILRAVDNSSITLGASIGQPTGTVTLNTFTGDITRTAGNISASRLNITTSGGDIGTLAMPLQTGASTIAALGGGDVFINNNAAKLTLLNATSGGVFQLNNNGGEITLNNIISSAPVSGGNGGDISVTGGNIVVKTNISLLANAAVNGNAGNVSLTGTAITGAGNLTVGANGAGTGDGGAVTITSGAGSSAGLTVSALGGAGGGDGGSLTLTATKDIKLGTVNVTGANGGAIDVTTSGGNIAVTGNTYWLADGFSGNGGSIDITGKGLTGTGNSVLSADGAANGNGGAVSVQTTLGQTVGLQGSATGAGTGLGGSFDIQAGGNIILLGGIDVSGATGGDLSVVGTGSLTAKNNMSFLADASNGDGGSITLQAKSIAGTGKLVALSADAGGTVGDGGAISVTFGNAYAVGSTSTIQGVSALGGSTSGDGGQVTLRSGGNLTVDSSLITAGVLGADGDGAQIELNAGYNGTAGSLFVNGGLNGNGVGNGDGGAISLISRSTTVFGLVPTATKNGITGQVTAESGNGTGNGGLVKIQNRGTGGLLIDAGQLSVDTLGDGDGGTILLYGALNDPTSLAASPLNIDPDQTVPATFGPGFTSSNLVASGAITIQNGSLNANANGASANGGTIAIVGTKITANSGALSINANGVGSGNGGTVDIGTTGANADIRVGNGNGQLNISAVSGATDGNGGTINIKATQGSIQVDPLFLNAGPQGANGNGATIQLAAGTNVGSANRNVLVNGSIDVSGVGNGNGGKLFIITNSAAPLEVGATTTNGVNGTITADGGATSGSGGTLVLSNYHLNKAGVAVSIPDYSAISHQASASGGSGGTLMISDLSANNVSPTAAVSILIPGDPVDVSGSAGGDFDGGTIVLQAGLISGFENGNLALAANGSGAGNGGTIVVRASSKTSSLVLGGGTGEISASATGGTLNSLAGNGGRIIASGGSLTTNPGSFDVSVLGDNGNGGSLAFTSQGTFTVSNSLDASGVGTGNGGEILITTGGATIFTTAVTLSAEAGPSGSVGGRVSLNNLRMDGLTGANVLTLNASDVSLTTTGGAITADYDTAGGVITANASGDINLTNVGTLESTLGTSKAGGIFNLDSAGGVVIDGVVTGTKGLNISATTGNITQGGATAQIVGPTVALSAAAGDIGTVPGSALLTKTGVLTASAFGDVFIKNTGALVLNASSSGDLFSLENAGAITVAQALNSPKVTLAVGNFSAPNNGALILKAQVGQSRAVGNNISLSTSGTGSITQTAGTFKIVGGNVSLFAGGGGSVGSAAAPIRTDSEGLGMITVKSAYGTHTGNVNILNSVAFEGTYKVVATGDINVTGAIQGSPIISVESTGGNILLSSRVGAAAFGNVTLKTNGGTINTTDPVGPFFGVLEGLNVTINTGGGDIGDLNPLKTTAAGLIVNAGTGDATFDWAPNTDSPISFFGYGLALNGVTANSLVIDANGPVIINSAVNANVVDIETQNINGLLPDLTRDIYIRANIGVANTGSTSLKSSNSGNGTSFSSADIVRLGGTILSSTVTLGSEDENIGTATAPILTASNSLSATTAGTGNVFISNNRNVILTGAAAPGGTFSLVTTGNAASPGHISVDTPITAVKDLILQTKAANGNIVLQGDIITASGSISLSANGSGFISDLNQTSILTAANNINLTSGKGDIGSDALRLQIGGGTVLTKTTGVGGAYINFVNSGSIGTSTAGSIFAASTNANGSSITIAGPVTAPTIDIAADGNIIGSSNVKNTLNGKTAVTLSSTTGDVGSVGTPVLTKAKTLSVATLDGSAFVKNTGALTLNASSTDNSTDDSVLSIQNVGTTVITGNLTSDNTVILASSGALTQTNQSAEIEAPNVTLTSAITPAATTTANFGTPTARIQVDTTNLTTDTKGKVYINNSATSSMNVAAFSGSAFDLTADNDVTVNGAINSPLVNIVSAGTVTLAATTGKTGGKTSITGADLTNTVAAKAIGTTVTLSTALGDIGATGLGNEFFVDTANLVVNQQGGNAYIADNTAGALNLSTAASSSHNEFVLTNSGNIAVKSVVDATTSINLNSGSGAISTASTGLLRSQSGTVTLGGGVQPQTGNIGTLSAPVKTDAATITANTSNGSVGLLNSGTAVTIGNSTSGQAFQVTDSSGSLTVAGTIQVAQGGDPAKKTNNLNLIQTAATGNITIDNDLTVTGGNILVNAKDPTGTITFNDNVDVLTNVAVGPTNGTIKIAVGAPPSTGKNPLTSGGNFTVTNTFPGTVFGGVNANALSATGAVALNAKGSNVIFNSATDNTINFASNITITADPPTSGAVSSAINNGGIATSDAKSSPLQVASQSYTAMPAAQPTAWSTAVLPSSSMMPLQGAVTATDVTSVSRVMPSIMVGDSSFTSVGDGEKIQKYIGESIVAPAANASKQGSLKAVGYHSTAATRGLPELGMVNGAVLFAPSKDLTVVTPVGDLKVKAGAAVLAVVQKTGTVSIFNLHDDGSEDVSINVSGHPVFISPGKHTTVARGSFNELAEVNAIDCIGHRNVRSAASGDYTVFSSEFSIASALKNLRALSELRLSHDPAQKRIADDIMKNAAIILQVGGKNGPYQRVGMPNSRVTAMQ